ncbi:MAG: glycosyltransferase [Lachnospiraceae bacterium]|nr:glycosyltransferase [Lachnospiraceae bacterium]
MKKGYYVHFQGRTSIGVSKKIDMQMEEFRKYYDMREIEVETPERSLVERIVGLFPVCSIRRNYGQALESIDNPAFLYVRRTVADKAYVGFLRQVKQRFPDCKIIIEIFTYPYDKDDFGKWNAWPFYLKEIMYRRQLKRYVDRFVTYTQDKEIFGVPAICTINGINVEGIRMVQGEYQENRLTMIGVAFMQKHHGYERIIEGLQEYYRDKNHKYSVRLLLVGDGPEKAKYLEMVEMYQLQDFVKFYPTMSGAKLDEMYDRSDIALSSFGTYKSGFYGKLSALKTRECLAKGMPMITGCEIDVLDDNYRYVRNFVNGPEKVDISEVVEFFENIIEEGIGKQEIAQIIRQYAYGHVGMESAIKPIIDYIES